MPTFRKPVPCPDKSCDKHLVTTFVPDNPGNLQDPHGIWVLRCPLGHYSRTLGRNTREMKTSMRQVINALP